MSRVQRTRYKIIFQHAFNSPKLEIKDFKIALFGDMIYFKKLRSAS